MNIGPSIIFGDNVSVAWARAFSALAAKGVDEISPLTICVSPIDEHNAIENPDIRALLDRSLKETGAESIHTVANTIFPASLWNETTTRSRFFKRYKRILPAIRKLSPANRYGVYFERLIAFGPEQKNQLEHIISAYLKNSRIRRSALQLGIFDPESDHTFQIRRGFPCLQQIAFNPNSDSGELSIAGFYATQYIYEKAYGNLIGLLRLGRFVAHELGLRLTKVTCVANVAEIGSLSKTNARELCQSFPFEIHNAS